MPDPEEYTFHTRFEAGDELEYIDALIRGKHALQYDEPTFLEFGAGQDDHPSPVDTLVAALGACQVSVLRQCFEKARIPGFHIDADVYADFDDLEDVPEEMPSNTAQRVRRIHVDIRATVPEEYEGRAERCLDVYDDGCIVGQSIRAGIEYEPTVALETD